jgi:putative heme-binding domain-containing protein
MQPGSSDRRAAVIAFSIVFLITLLSSSPSLHAQRAAFAIPDPDPEIERRSFLVADGFEVNLFAAAPLIAKPIQMNFDPTGRLWIASSEVYPQLKPGQVANDKVIILEDRDGDGRADKTTVFADGLLIPTGVEPGDGGAYVANSTELLHLKDTDGDGRADHRRVVLSGFGTEDTHHILHTLRWGHDGMLYFNQSIYIHSHIETPRSVRRLGGGGIWRFRPETMELDVFIRGLWNPWGHQVDRWGQSFATDGAGGEGINYCLPGAYYDAAPDAVRVLRGLNPGSPKYCGLEVASGRHIPESWLGSLLTNDFRGNRVCRFTLEDDGGGFAAREQAELIRTPHVAFRPIDIKMGPDGAIYIADWYNPIIQHGEVDFRDPRRDHTRGRIWRVTAKGRPLVSRPKLVGSSLADLFEALKAPEDWTRHHAKRVLKERGASVVVPSLAAWVKALDASDPEVEHHRLEALWTYQALDVVEPGLLSELLGSRDPRVRAAATRVVQFWHRRLPEPLVLLAQRVEDENPRVRLEAVRVLASIPTIQAAGLAMRALDRPIDSFLDYALWLTARQLQLVWLPEVRAGRFAFDGSSSRLQFALQAVGTADVLGPLLALFQGGHIPAERDESAQALITALGGPAQLALVLDVATDQDKLAAPRRAALLGALIRTTRDRKVIPAGDLTRLRRLLGLDDSTTRALAAQAAGLWKVAALQPEIAELAAAKESSSDARKAAIGALLELGDPASRKVVDDLAEQDTMLEIQGLALAALASSDPRAAAPRAARWLGRLRLDQTDWARPLLASFVERKEGPAALARSLEQATIAPDLAKLCIRDVRASGRTETELIAAFSKAGRLTSITRSLDSSEMGRFLVEVACSGDVARGEAIFRRPELTCLKCHAIAGAGGQVGPGLESIGASAPGDYIVDALLEPGKAIKENYHSTIVATSDGKLIAGIRVRQSDQELILRDAEDREVVIPTRAIEEQKPGGSLMPAGLTDVLTRAELVDLVRFLTELGKIGPYAISKDRMLRCWQVLTPTSEARRLLNRTSLDAAINDNNSLVWSPLYTTVAGLLPLGELPAVGRGAGRPPIVLARSQLDVSHPGRVKLRFNSALGLTFWMDGRRIEPTADRADELICDLATGLHTLTVAVLPARREQAIRCTLDDVAGSGAQARVVLGK